MTKTKPATTGLVITSIANNHHHGGADATEDDFRRLKGVETVTQFLKKANFDPAIGAYHITIVSQAQRTTVYPVISNVRADTPHGVKFRYRPQPPICANPNHQLFVLRLTVSSSFRIPIDTLAFRLKLAASRLYGSGPDDDDVVQPAVNQPNPDTVYAAVRTLIDLSFTSDDRATWAASAAQEVGPKEDPVVWDTVIRGLASTGKLVWDETTGYKLPFSLPSLAADKPKTEPILPFKPEEPAKPAAAVVTTTPVVHEPVRLTDDLHAVMERLGTVQSEYNAAISGVHDAEWAVRDTSQEVESLKAKLAAAEANHAKAKAALTAKKLAQLSAVGALNPDDLVALAARLEEARRVVKKT